MIRFKEDYFVEFPMGDASMDGEIGFEKVRMVLKAKTHNNEDHWVRLYVENGNDIEWKADITRDALHECLQWMKDADEEEAIAKQQEEGAKGRLVANGHQ